MKRDFTKEEEFYSKEFQFSYSSINKLMFSPTLFYRDYVLGKREESTDKHLVEGKLIHCLLFEPGNLKNKFNIIPSKVPTDSVKKVLYLLKDQPFKPESLLSTDPNHQKLILDALESENLYQTLKEDSKRLEKIQTQDNDVYWKFLNTSKLDVIDQDTLTKCQEQIDIIKENKDVMELFNASQTDFELDGAKSFVEKPLMIQKLKDYSFGLKGIVDYYKIDDERKEVVICDLKTTSKTISDFKETIDFYNYWLQMAIYGRLVFENLTEDEKDYQIMCKFVVIDKYNQVYVFDVADETLISWGVSLITALNVAQYHYEQRNYSLPYMFLTQRIVL
jgi:hypothetical protein